MTGFDCRLIFSGFVSIVALSFAHPAWADCATPTGVEGDQIYNTTHDVMQFCNGTDWVNMGAAGGGASETDPEVGAITASKWCAANVGGTAIVCDKDAPGGGGTVDVQTFNASGTWTKPGTGSMTYIQCWGGGGGGGRGQGGNAGGGGGGGGYNERWMPTSGLAATVAVTVGAGGAGLSGSNGAGGGGGTTSFGTHLSAYGGGGGNLSGGAGGGGGQLSAGATGNGSTIVLGGNPPVVVSGDGTGGLYTAGSSGISGNYWHGGGGSTSPGGVISMHGGGGGGSCWWLGGGSTNYGTPTPPGTSLYGGNGGASLCNGASAAGAQPGGGGGGTGHGSSGAGGAGRCIVTTF